ncbi:MAG: transketolase, partial [Myxococcales bacterium]|nr:transketolase [Myxococcales bacterium]
RESLGHRGSDAFAAWQTGVGAYEGAYPELAAELRRAIAGELPEGWDRDLPVFEASEKGMATRKASGDVLAALAGKVPNLVGGSADLAGSNLSFQKGLPEFQDHDGAGAPRNVHWGIREHGMASAVNGMALHGGVIPYGATFLIFADYMKPALRLSALMGVPSRFIFSHDSVGLGEDGPTHQPVEQLASLRMIPGFCVLRPGDANETREAWKVFLSRKGPTALVLTRQNLPTLDRTEVASAEGLHRGAYVLAEASAEPSVILIATGSEVPLALAARDKLENSGTPTRVVSMPSWELFEAQGQDYRDEVLPPKVTARVAIEAGCRFGWEKWVGTHGGFVTIDRFGASAPFETIFEKFGFTPDAVAAEAKRVLALS